MGYAMHSTRITPTERRMSTSGPIRSDQVESSDFAATTEAPGAAPLLSVRNLSVEYSTADGTVHAVSDISFDVFPRETVGLVGESGCGKTATCLAILGLLRPPVGRVAGGEVLFRGDDLTKMHGKTLRKLRGREISLILQESISALNPVKTIGAQINEAIRVHNRSLSRAATRSLALELLAIVGIPEPRVRYGRYPHELSGGMRQRAMIAIAIANGPSLLVADEPTTALDVTIQAQIVEVLKRAQDESHAATLLITHDLGLVSQVANRIVVMYAGRIVESGDVYTIFASPRHPYTVGLLASRPRLSGNAEWLTPIPGQPPSLLGRPAGCPFQPRCVHSNGRQRCIDEMPVLRRVAGRSQLAACHFAEEIE
jgi:oligopeptide/dipeptide ABC transporter ATP-binding protein